MGKNIFLFVLFFALYSCKTTMPLSENTKNDKIRLNQIGYYPVSIKKAVFTEKMNALDFHVIDVHTRKSVFKSSSSDLLDWELAGEQVRIADFSALEKPGHYVLYHSELGESFPFEIRNHVLKNAFLASLKALYFQRMSMPLEKKYAGKFSRPMAHPDTELMYHPSSGKAEGKRSSPGGWYDAGDFNKYVLNGAFPLGQMMSLYEVYPNLVGDNATNIPESGNGKSDFLDEMKYELDWLLTMQDDDGGLFHKASAKNFQGMVMPHEPTAPRFIIGKGTGASLDFAACMAQASRVYREYSPSFANQCLKASQNAWNWALKNPNIQYTNPKDISTGEYGDDNFKDEWFWAAAELFVSTKEKDYLKVVQDSMPFFEYKSGDTWKRFMSFQGLFSMLRNRVALPDNLKEDLESKLIHCADVLQQKITLTDYFQPIQVFHWGSNSDQMNAAMVLANAYQIKKNPKYLNAIQETVDYIFGKNATGYCFLTGFGDKSPMYIHHRQSDADGIDDPIPGLLSGGPNPKRQDVDWIDDSYPKNNYPMQSWTDHVGSFASNEICLNWNAPLIYILGFLEAEME